MSARIADAPGSPIRLRAAKIRMTLDELVHMRKIMPPSPVIKHRTSFVTVTHTGALAHNGTFRFAGKDDSVFHDL
jgi:hypothetical protein